MIIVTITWPSLLKGENGSRYEYNYTTRLYTKIPVDITNVSNIDFEQFHLNLSDILVGLEFVTQKPKNTIHYGDGKDGKLVQQPPFYISYQTPDTICFTRNSSDELDSIRLHDWLSLNRSFLDHDQYRDVKLQIFIHYPGQLLRSFDNPSFTSLFSEYETKKRLEFRISHVTTLRNRHDSNVPCNKELEDDDAQLQMEIIKLIGCVPIYWTRIAPKYLGLDECKFPAKLEKVYDYIRNYREVLLLYDHPCVDMTVMVMYNTKGRFTQYHHGFFPGKTIMKFQYQEKYYLEIENVKEFGFESFWSSVGGFIGIFLGYSILQIPELLNTLKKIFKIKKENKERNVRYRKKDKVEPSKSK